MAKPEARTRGEKVEAFRELLGLQLDAEIGRRAGVPADFVRAHREKLGIPSLAERRAGVAPAVVAPPAPPPAAAPAAPKPTPRERKAPGGIASPLDAHLALFGTMRDAAIAEIAGVSRGAVYQYRQRRKIAAYVGPVAPKPPAPVAKPPAPVAKPPAPVAKPPAPVVAVPVVTAPSLAYVVVVRRDERDEPFIVLGRDVADASAHAMRAARGEIVSVRRYLPALA